MKQRKFAAVVLAAGQGKRMNSSVQKQYLQLSGHPVLYYALKAFEKSQVDEVVLVTGEGETEYCRREIIARYGFQKVQSVVAGGRERYHSVYHGLNAIQSADYVLIHDGARPFLNNAIINRAMDGAVRYEACVVGMPVKDTIKLADEEGVGAVTPQRDKVWMVQTPQAFSFPLIEKAYKRLIEQEKNGHTITVTDDAMVLETMCARKSKLVEGSYENIKITTPSDLKIAEIFSREECWKNNG